MSRAGHRGLSPMKNQVIDLSRETAEFKAKMCPACGAIIYIKLGREALDGEALHKEWHAQLK
jgi:hypothetical protein